MNAPCQSPLTLDVLVAYWIGDLDRGNEERIEAHYLGCAFCARRLAQLENLAQGIRALARTSGVTMIASEAFMRRLVDDGFRVREYRVPLNGSVDCTITPEDDFIVGYLEAPLAGVRRIDMLTLAGNGDVVLRQDDIPFVAENDTVVFVPGVAGIRALPRTSLQVRLLAVGEAGDQVIGDFRFDHSPYNSQDPA